MAGTRRAGRWPSTGQVKGLCLQPREPLEMAQLEPASAGVWRGPRSAVGPAPAALAVVKVGALRGTSVDGSALTLPGPARVPSILVGVVSSSVSGPLRLVPRPDPDLMAKVGAAGRTCGRCAGRAAWQFKCLVF